MWYNVIYFLFIMYIYLCWCFVHSINFWFSHLWCCNILSSECLLYNVIGGKICLSIHQSIHLSVYPFINPFIYLSIHSLIHLCICLSIHWSIHLSVYPFIDPSMYLSIHLLIHLSICLSIHWFIHLFIPLLLAKHCVQAPSLFNKHNISNSINLSTKQNKRFTHYLLIYTLTIHQYIMFLMNTIICVSELILW